MMQRATALRLSALATALLAASGADAQPKFVHTSNASDLTASGNSTIGTILDPNVDSRLTTFTRGTGHQLLGPVLTSIDGRLRCSDDLLFASTGLYNGSFGPYWGGFGDYGSSGHGHFLPHRFSAATGTWTNCGSFPNQGGLGASMCDSTIATPYDISSDGRFIVGGGWYGGYGAIGCHMRGFIYDNNDGSVKMLPLIGTGCQPFSQAEVVSSNGNVVMGSDSHESPDPDGAGPEPKICNARCITVWERDAATGEFLASGRTVLDDYGAGGLSAGAMNRSGTQIAASMSALTAGYVLGDVVQQKNLFKYVKNTTTGAWDRVSLGRCADRTETVACMRPTAISDDGSTIVGIASYGQCGFFGTPRPFIWRPTINGGVPIDLADYLQSINGGTPFPAEGAINVGQAISADGNAILATLIRPDDTCPGGAYSLAALPQGGILYLDGSSIPCEPPRIAGGPYDHVTTSFTSFGTPLNVFASGSHPMTLQWQKESPAGSNTWVDLTNDCAQFDPNVPWHYEGVHGFQLRVGELPPASERNGNYRLRITNACGTITSSPATVSTVAGACCYVPRGGSQIVCSIELANRCTGSTTISYFLGGTYLGDNTVCTPTSCDAAVGACCYGAGGPDALCVIDVAPHCTASVANGGYAGTYSGNGTTCAAVAPCAPVSGACCYSTSNTTDTVCTTEVESHCTRAVHLGGLGGAFLGGGATCSPSACSTVAGACCYAPDSGSDVICTIQTQIRCTNLPSNPAVQGYVSGLQGIYVGHGSTCLPVSQQCGFVSGSCCYSLDDTSNAICTVQTLDRCTRNKNNNGLGGVYGGDGTTCGPNSCATVTGACCYSTFNDPTTQLCTIQPGGRCTNRFYAGGLFGVYLGGGTTCTPTGCDTALGACCYAPPGTTCLVCSLQPQLRCTDPVNGGLGGTFAGVGVACSPTNCVLNVGACCVSGICNLVCATVCADNFGDYRGDGTTCSPDPCNPNPIGACCRGSICASETATACVGANAAFAGPGTVCSSYGVNNVVPCCLANFNQVGGVTVQDIFDYLAAYFSVSPLADVNGSGGVTVQDIFDYLSVYFAGCA